MPVASDTDVKTAAVGEFVGDCEQVLIHRVDGDIGTETFSKRAFFRNRLRNEDFGGTGFDGDLQYQQADGPATGDNHGIPVFTLAISTACTAMDNGSRNAPTSSGKSSGSL